MAVNYATHYSATKTPQSEPIPDTNQVENSAGGYSFPVDDWTRLDRFLVLGNEGGSYYATERAMTIENARAVERCWAADPARTAARIAEISEAGRAPKNDPALFALAIGSKRPEALEVLPRVARIGTHLFQFAEMAQAFRGWGRGLRRAVARWYTEKEPKNLAYQVVKYQQRNGWSHRDLLRLSHPRFSGESDAIAYYVTKQGWPDNWQPADAQGALTNNRMGVVTIAAVEHARRAATKEEICRLIRDYDLPRECVPTQWLTEASVWEALLERMPMTAMIRNLATMTRVGLLAPMSAGTTKVVSELGNADRLRKARVHPIAVLAALLTYKAGRGERGQHTWNPVSQVVDALDAAFYSAFGNVEPTGKRWLLALDVSGSMNSGTIAGVPGLSPRVASAALALVTANVEPQHLFVAFTSGGYRSPAADNGQYAHMGYQNGISPLAVSPRQRLDDVCRETAALPMGGTDCALPMLYAAEYRIPVDVFVILTDSETWHGAIHPAQALQQYRQRMGIPAKMIVCGMVSNGFSIADPEDAGQMDVVGFDTATPQLMSQFAAG